jgi:cytidine deaminase
MNGWQAVSGGRRTFLAVAITADAGEQFVGPCGACRCCSTSPHTEHSSVRRQFLAEFNPDIPIYLVRPDLAVQVLFI